MAEPLAWLAFFAAGSADTAIANLLSWTPYAGILGLVFLAGKFITPSKKAVRAFLRQRFCPKRNTRAQASWGRLVKHVRHISKLRRLWASIGTHLRDNVSLGRKKQ